FRKQTAENLNVEHEYRYTLHPNTYTLVLINDDRRAAGRWDAANHLHTLNFRQVRTGGMPKLHPERARRSVNCESRSIVHHSYTLCRRSRSQLVHQFGNEWLEFVELDQDGIIGNLCRRQIDRLGGLEQ